MSLMLGWDRRVNRHWTGAVGIAAACWGFAIIAFGFAGQLWLALLCLAIAGASDMISGVFRMIIWNQTIPDHLRGRLAGIELISYHTGPMLGNAESGVVASLFSIRTAVVSGGILCVVGTGLRCWRCPRFEVTTVRPVWCKNRLKKGASALHRSTVTRQRIVEACRRFEDAIELRVVDQVACLSVMISR